MKQAAILALLVLLIAGCGARLNVQVNEGGVDITVGLDETRVNELLANSAAVDRDQNGILNQITSVDMSEGFIRVYGYREASGVRTEGSFDLVFSVQDGDLMA